MLFLGENRIDGLSVTKPVPASFAQGTFEPTTTINKNDTVILPLADAVGTLSSYINGAEFTVPIAGVYTISAFFGMVDPTDTAGLCNYFVQIDFNNGLGYQNAFGLTRAFGRNRTQYISGTIALDKGAKLQILIHNSEEMARAFCVKGTGADALGGWWNITLVEQVLPSIVADSHFVISSNEPGKVAINSDSGQMTANNVLTAVNLPINTDLNDVKITGTYFLSDITGISNLPIAYKGVLEVWTNDVEIKQVYALTSYNNYKYERTFFNNVWSTWQRVQFKSDEYMTAYTNGLQNPDPNTNYFQYYKILELTNPGSSGQTKVSLFMYWTGSDSAPASFGVGIIAIRLRGTGTPAVSSLAIQHHAMITSSQVSWGYVHTGTDTSGVFTLYARCRQYFGLNTILLRGAAPLNPWVNIGTAQPSDYTDLASV
ncbi:MAG: pyocin knob domain-containing protein [Endomicrobium sp.]|jgi:hypothetical protein|uniref:pyocin knob domain-containing protein n=1 Tax=Candidatus Endomicrobiellum cubanum TaxID=3242325 RepID=UPI00281FAD99|nr:pyocin knob domain-containing protein [Endomicrobium sp.]